RAAPALSGCSNSRKASIPTLICRACLSASARQQFIADATAQRIAGCPGVADVGLDQGGAEARQDHARPHMAQADPLPFQGPARLQTAAVGKGSGIATVRL